MSEKIKIKRIKPESTIQIVVSSTFYEYAKQAFYAHLSSVDSPDDFIKEIVDMESDVERDHSQAVYEVLLAFLSTVERAATEKDLIEEVEVDLPEEITQDPS